METRVLVGSGDVLDGFELRSGEMVLIGARPASGKTHLACQLVKSAIQRGVHVFYWAIEESAESIFKKVAPSDTEIPFLHVDDNPRLTVGALSTLLELHVDKYGPSVVVVIDYLGLGHGSPARLVEMLRSLCAQKKITAIVLSQVRLPETEFPNLSALPGLEAHLDAFTCKVLISTPGFGDRFRYQVLRSQEL